ncbi:MAG: transcription elongation factor Spt5 [Candidatus Micrarchaeota archaeon]|nr:transcription elongation factor Spt5 [Candidatus Micrarchaeota archaeon]
MVKVTSGQEKIAANILQNKMTKSDLPIYSIMVVDGMRGYIILEAEDEISVRQFATKGKSVRGVLPTALPVEEVKKLIETRSNVVKIEKGDIVEFTSGPLKGYEAKVLKIDEAKGNMIVERLDVVVPIALTVKMNIAKIVKKAKAEESTQ